MDCGVLEADSGYLYLRIVGQFGLWLRNHKLHTRTLFKSTGITYFYIFWIPGTGTWSYVLLNSVPVLYCPWYRYFLNIVSFSLLLSYFLELSLVAL